MNKAETIRKLADSRITRHALNADAFDAFVKHMRSYQYGREETAQAHGFYVAGWMARERSQRCLWARYRKGVGRCKWQGEVCVANHSHGTERNAK